MAGKILLSAPKRKKPLSSSDIALKYASDVKAKRTPANKWVRLACARFIADLKRKDLTYNKIEANRACDFIELLPQVKGKFRGLPLKLEGWELFIVCSLFGFYRKSTGCRKYDEAFILITRKMGKSILAAAIGLYMLLNDGENSPEVYCGATTEKQANFVFNPAKQMCKLSPDLMNAFNVEVMAQAITTPEDDGLFQRVVGDPGDGGNPSCWINDEYHEHKKDNLYQTGKTGIGARDNPLLLSISTAGDNIEGPCYELHERAEQILENVTDDLASDSLFCIMWGIDKNDDWQSEEALIKANPNIGISVSYDWLRKQQLNAITNQKDRGNFKTKHLNMWLNALDSVIPTEEWMKCAKKMDIEKCKSLPCIIGIDLANSIDIVATVKNFFYQDEKKTYYFWFPQFWLPEARVYEKGAPEYYRKWVEEGYLNVCSGERITTQDIKDSLRKDCKDYNVMELVFDPWKASGYEQDLEDTGAEIVMFPQTIGMYTTPMNELIASVKDKSLYHNDNKVLNWMNSNLRAKMDTNGNMKPRKEDSKKKIDGMCAGIMALGRSLAYRDEIIDFGTASIIKR
jgi:phage terminase large subunit-like protein